MTATVLPFERPAPDLHVELTSPGVLADGARCYHVSYVERGGHRSLVWASTDYVEAEVAAIDCGGPTVPVWDLTAQVPA